MLGPILLCFVAGSVLVKVPRMTASCSRVVLAVIVAADRGYHHKNRIRSVVQRSRKSYLPAGRPLCRCRSSTGPVWALAFPLSAELAVNGSGKLVMESVVETKSTSVFDFLHGLRGELHVTLEEGTWAALAVRRAQTPREGDGGLQPASQPLLKESSKSG